MSSRSTEGMRFEAGAYGRDLVTPAERDRIDAGGSETFESQKAHATDAEAIVWSGMPMGSADVANDWTARWTIASQGSELVVRALTIEPQGQRTPLGGITGTLLRKLYPTTVTDFAAQAQAGVSSVEKSLQMSQREFIDAPEPDGRRGRPPLSDDLLAHVAEMYLEELPKGKGVYGRMSERLQRPPETVRDWIYRCRQNDWLTSAPKQGRRGGLPGDRLVEFRARARGES